MRLFTSANMYRLYAFEPTFTLGKGSLGVSFPRNSHRGPRPSWVEKSSSLSRGMVLRTASSCAMNPVRRAVRSKGWPEVQSVSARSSISRNDSLDYSGSTSSQLQVDFKSCRRADRLLKWKTHLGHKPAQTI